MKSKALLILAAFTMLFVIGCRGNRTVKAYVNTTSPWNATLQTGNNTPLSYSGNKNAVYDLGNTNDKVTLTGSYTHVTYTATDSINLKIIEYYDDGFLYTASSMTKAEASADSGGTIVTATYDFSQK
jgi:amino acid permease